MMEGHGWGGRRRPLQLEEFDRRDVALVDEFIQSLPPLSKRRIDKHRNYVLNSQKLWFHKSLEECTQQDLKRFVLSLEDFRLGRVRSFENTER